MMIVFFFGMGASALLVALTQNAWQLAAALTLLGAFAAIYHPVGIPMLVQHANSPGAAIGINGLAGNLGIAVAALVTALARQVARLARGLRGARASCPSAAASCSARLAPRETEPPAKRARKASVSCRAAQLARAFAVMTVAATASSLSFNFTTNGNAQLLAERMHGDRRRPGHAGRDAGGGLRARLAGAGRGGPADRPHAAQAPVPLRS